MATPTPFQLARPGAGAQSNPRVRHITHYKPNSYYFARASTTHGTGQLAAVLPPTGPGSAGATFPSNRQQVDYVEVIVDGTIRPDQMFGTNSARP